MPAPQDLPKQRNKRQARALADARLLGREGAVKSGADDDVQGEPTHVRVHLNEVALLGFRRPAQVASELQRSWAPQ